MDYTAWFEEMVDLVGYDNAVFTANLCEIPGRDNFIIQPNTYNLIKTYCKNDAGGKSKNKRKEIKARDRYEVYAREGYKCAICKSEVDVTIDHVIPVTRGGRSEKENYIALCGKCNLKKKDHPLLDLIIKNNGYSGGLYDMILRSGIVQRFFGEPSVLPCDDAVRIGIKKALEG